MTEQTLFDPKTTEKPKCKACGATAKSDCQHDFDLDQGVASPTRRRPRSCLASAQLGPTDPFPEGY